MSNKSGVADDEKRLRALADGEVRGFAERAAQIAQILMKEHRQHTFRP